jgi:hypothetical protein
MSHARLAACLVALTLIATAVRSTGSEECCSYCGCHNRLKKVCRLVCDTKKVTETHYDVKCEDICIHGRSQKCGCECIPTCKKVKTVKKLMKIETTKEVPVYKCVVETICCDCCDKLAAGGHPMQAYVAAKPAR